MKNFFAAILIGAIAWMPGTAMGQQLDDRCAKENGTVVAQSNYLVSICKLPLRDGQSPLITDSLRLYKFNPDLSLKAMISLTVFKDGDYLITFGEVASKETTQFLMRDRKFKEWTEAKYTNPTMIRKYKGEIGMVVNAFESLSADFGTF